MKERPILMSAPMVRALLAGTKTQTRRPLKQQPSEHHWTALPGYELRRIVHPVTIDGRTAVRFSHTIPHNPAADHDRWALCPYGQPGDRLWVREAWQYSDWTEDGEPWIGYAACGEPILCRTFDEEWNNRLGDIWAALSNPENYDIDNRAADRRWRPSIHMPRWASRITLEVTDVRVERLQDISPQDALAEGITHSTLNDPRVEYRWLWESINGAGSWDANPWVWCVSFRNVSEPHEERASDSEQP